MYDDCLNIYISFKLSCNTIHIAFTPPLYKPLDGGSDIPSLRVLICATSVEMIRFVLYSPNP